MSYNNNPLSIQYDISLNKDGDPIATIRDVRANDKDLVIPSHVLFQGKPIPVGFIGKDAFEHLNAEFVIVPRDVTVDRLFSSPRENDITISFAAGNNQVNRNPSQLYSIAGGDPKVELMLAGSTFMHDQPFKEECERSGVKVCFGDVLASREALSQHDLNIDTQQLIFSNPVYRFECVGGQELMTNDLEMNDKEFAK